ncbi:MAG: CopG family antitoxin [Candidatus Dormiibacterota bacterium]
MTNDRAIGQRFGPEPHQVDPYEGMSGDEFVAEVEAAITAARKRQRAISLKLPEELLARTKAEASRHGLPYQTFIKVVLEKSLDRLGRGGVRP